MGKLQGGILGIMTGKVGGVVGSTWKDKNTLRSYRSSIAVNNTAKAVASKTVFAECVAKAIQINGVIGRDLWQRFEKSQSGYNALVAQFRSAYLGDNIFTPNALILSKGKIEETPIQSASINATTKDITITWNTATTGYQLSSDIPYVVIMSIDYQVLKAYNGDDLLTKRSDGEIVIPNFQQDGTYNKFVYLMFRRNDGTMTSISTFADAEL